MKPSPEYAAGGIVQKGHKLLIVQVENLQRQKVWTFPKGHIKMCEKNEEAALRKVEEETGYRCEIIQLLDQERYWFNRNHRPVRKNVLWFLMKPLRKTRDPDPKEIIEVQWVTLPEAVRRVTYRSDKRLLQKLAQVPHP